MRRKFMLNSITKVRVNRNFLTIMLIASNKINNILQQNTLALYPRVFYSHLLLWIYWISTNTIVIRLVYFKRHYPLYSNFHLIPRNNGTYNRINKRKSLFFIRLLSLIFICVLRSGRSSHGNFFSVTNDDVTVRNISPTIDLSRRIERIQMNIM